MEKKVEEIRSECPYYKGEGSCWMCECHSNCAYGETFPQAQNKEENGQ